MHTWVSSNKRKTRRTYLIKYRDKWAFNFSLFDFYLFVLRFLVLLFWFIFASCLGASRIIPRINRPKGRLSSWRVGSLCSFGLTHFIFLSLFYLCWVWAMCLFVGNLFCFLLIFFWMFSRLLSKLGARDHLR